MTLQAAPKIVVKAKTQLEMNIRYHTIGTVYAVLDKFDCQRLGEDYLEGGALVCLKVRGSC